MGISSLSRILDLSRNQLIGSIPMEVGKLVNLGFLDISDNKLTGKIPNTLSSCKMLEILDMSGNFLQGIIPESMSSLRGIRELDLSRNNLSGKIPIFLEGFKLEYLNLSFEVPKKGVFSNSSAFSVTGNTRICGGVPELNLPRCKFNEPKNHNLSPRLKMIISIVGGLAGLILIFSFLFLYRPRKARNDPTLSSSVMNSDLNMSYGDLLKATNGFSSANLIGRGSFWSVYKGILNQDENVVAVKVINLQRRGASKSFMAECEALRNIKHRNLVKIITACSSIDFQGNDFMALVYEFMVNGSLEDWLHPIGELKDLNLIQRLNIAIDVANALDYLHNHCPTQIAQCNLKPSNVLLDMDMTAHVGDFGLAKFIDAASLQFSSNETSSLGIRGSIGYAAPEYAMGYKVSACGDVYSFGILLLEMFTGRRPTDDMFKDGSSLHNHALMGLYGPVEEIVDQKMILQVEQGNQNRNHVN